MSNAFQNYVSPYAKYRDKYLSYELGLNELREDPFAITRMLDELPTVFDYFSELSAAAEEQRESLEESLSSTESHLRELTQDLLERERSADNNKKSPTMEDIRARFSVLFTQFRSRDLSPENKVEIKKFYRDNILKWVYVPGPDKVVDLVEQERLAELLYNSLSEFIVLRNNCREAKRRDVLLKNRVKALHMRKDTLITQASIIKQMVEKGVPLIYSRMETKIPDNEGDIVVDDIPTTKRRR